MTALWWLALAGAGVAVTISVVLVRRQSAAERYAVRQHRELLAALTTIDGHVRLTLAGEHALRLTHAFDPKSVALLRATLRETVLLLTRGTTERPTPKVPETRSADVLAERRAEEESVVLLAARLHEDYEARGERVPMTRCVEEARSLTVAHGGWTSE